MKSFGDLVGGDSFVGVFRYGGMPLEVAERSMRLFAAEVDARVEGVDTGGGSPRTYPGLSGRQASMLRRVPPCVEVPGAT